MSCLSVFPPPPSDGEITLCEFNARLISESSETADVSKYVPATQVMCGQTFIVSVCYIPFICPLCFLYISLSFSLKFQSITGP